MEYGKEGHGKVVSRAVVSMKGGAQELRESQCLVWVGQLKVAGLQDLLLPICVLGAALRPAASGSLAKASLSGPWTLPNAPSVPVI